MGVDALIDTGAILALLDRADRWHNICQDEFAQLRLPLTTFLRSSRKYFTWPARIAGEWEAVWTFVRSGAVRLAEIQDSELPHIHALMSRYWDRPMDFADGTLVHLAKRESLSTIFTVDYADFETYRIEGRRAFACCL